jgi:hypothetical protein
MPYPVSYVGTIALGHNSRGAWPRDLKSHVEALREAFVQKGASEFVSEKDRIRFRVKWWVATGPLWMIDKGEVSLVPDKAGHVRFVISFWRSVVPLTIAVILVFGVINAPFGLPGRIVVPIVGFLWLVTPGYLFAVWRFSRFVRQAIR